MTLINATRGTVVAQKVREAGTLWQRIRGLIGSKALEPGEGFLIGGGCPQVHTFFMSYPIDVAFLSNENIVTGIATLPPWRVSGFFAQAACVLEAQAGTMSASGTQVGDRIERRG